MEFSFFYFKEPELEFTNCKWLCIVPEHFMNTSILNDLNYLLIHYSVIAYLQVVTSFLKENKSLEC